MPQQIRQPQPYRLHIFDAKYEVLADRVTIVWLDLTRPGYEGELRSQLAELTRQAEDAGELMTRPRLEVRDADGNKVRDWTGA